MTCLIALEVNAPAGAKPVVWRLLTNRTATTLQAAVELYMVIAWRINRLMRLGRTLPDLPTDLLFEPDERRSS